MWGLSLDIHVSHGLPLHQLVERRPPSGGKGQIIATSHDLGPQKVAKEGKSPYFREIQVGEIL